MDLGVCIPDEDLFVTYGKIPTKHLGNTELHFYATESNQLRDMDFVPIDPHNTFDYIEKLMAAKFCVQSGKRGLLISRD